MWHINVLNILPLFWDGQNRLFKYDMGWIKAHPWQCRWKRYSTAWINWILQYISELNRYSLFSNKLVFVFPMYLLLYLSFFSFPTLLPCNSQSCDIAQQPIPSEAREPKMHQKYLPFLPIRVLLVSDFLGTVPLPCVISTEDALRLLTNYDKGRIPLLNRMNFWKKCQRGRGVIFNPKICVAGFGTFKQVFLSMKLIEKE